MLSLQVSKERGEELAIEYGIKFMETSAKASINVEEAFFTLARDIKAKMEKRLVSIHNFNPSYRSNIQDSSDRHHNFRVSYKCNIIPLC